MVNSFERIIIYMSIYLNSFSVDEHVEMKVTFLNAIAVADSLQKITLYILCKVSFVKSTVWNTRKNS